MILINVVRTLFSIDIYKCRKNILHYGDFDYCIFTVFDKIDEFKGTKIQPGLYYVETIIKCLCVVMDGIITIWFGIVLKKTLLY